MPGGYELNQPVTLTCPDCGGSMRETTVDSLPYYTCHIGHRFAADDMSEAQSRKLEEALGVALRALNERMALCRRLADTALAKGHVRAAEHWEAARQEVEEKAAVLRAVLEKGWDRPAPVDSPEPDGPAE